jgi:hypothetical protein
MALSGLALWPWRWLVVQALPLPDKPALPGLGRVYPGRLAPAPHRHPVQLEHIGCFCDGHLSRFDPGQDAGFQGWFCVVEHATWVLHASFCQATHKPEWRLTEIKLSA